MIRKFTDIPGWFFWADSLLFAALLQVQRDSSPGVLVELGTYLGKSAVVIGDFVRPGDRFVTLDLFGREDLASSGAADGFDANLHEVRGSYPTLSRRQFEKNYLALHSELPEIVEGLSASIVTHVDPGSVRFIHVDASHLYDQVRIDVANTATLLRPGGIAVFDDWRSEHTPGVSAAVWEAVFTLGLVPVAVTPHKLYGVYSHPEPYRLAVRELVDRDPQIWSEEQQIAGHPVLRLKLAPKTRVAARSPLTDAEVDALAARLADKLVPQLDDYRTTW